MGLGLGQRGGFGQGQDIEYCMCREMEDHER